MRYALPLLLCLALVGCATGSALTPAPFALRIAGSTSLQPVIEDLAAAYQTTVPNMLIDVRGGGSTIGAQQLREGRIDLAVISWQPEGQTLPDNLRAVPVARDGIAIIVHPSNPLANITSLQLRALYRGTVLDWAELGSPAGPPVVISREDGSGTRAAFEALAMGNERVTLNALVMPTGQAVVDYVASHRDAVGYVSSGMLTAAVRAVPVEEVAPTAAALRSGAYRLGRALYIYTTRPPSAQTQAFVDFVLSPAGQAIIARHVIPVR